MPNKQDDKIIQLLKQSKQNFRFDEKNIKQALLAKLNARHFHLQEKIKLPEVIVARSILVHKISYALTAVILFVGSGATLALANTAKPGDKLFNLDQLQERVALKLPLSDETKAQLRADIVAERVYELSQIQTQPGRDDVKVQAVNSTQESLTKAVEAVSANREKLKKKGEHNRVKKLNNILTQLEGLAREQENQATGIKNEIKDEELKNTVNSEVNEIRKARLKAQLELSDEDNDEDRDNDDEDRSGSDSGGSALPF